MNATTLVTKLLEDDPDVLRPKDYLRQLPARQEEYWVFDRNELQHPEHARRTDIFIAHPTVTDYDKEGDWEPDQGVIVYRDGQVSNRWSDGTAGVPDVVVQAADELEEYYSPEFGDFVNAWRRVYTNETGEFLGWAPEKWKKG